MDDIEFGFVQHREPDNGQRPDRDPGFSVVACGQVNPDHLPIFVDLDVMRDMEGHARTNLHVELGGVLVGGQYIDRDGRPFVIIKEAIRAEHYEATRGSFKFTHETWSAINRQCEALPNDLNLVGWYHTHPDWGVFLSGMDMFICDNFFNDNLDVDLVIDPCRGDRGWFFWETKNGNREKTRVSGFYLYSNRFRRSEVLQFAAALSAVNPAYFDPRYEAPVSEIAGLGDSSMQPVVNIQESRSSAITIAVIGMLTLQMLALAVIAWRLLFPPLSTDAVLVSERNRGDVYRELVQQMVIDSDPNQNPARVVERLDGLAEKHTQLQTDLKGRDALIRDQKSRLSALSDDIATLRKKMGETDGKLQQAQSSLGSTRQELVREKELNQDIKEGRAIGGPGWPVTAAIALASALVGILGGHWFGRHLEQKDDPVLKGNSFGRRTDGVEVD